MNPGKMFPVKLGKNDLVEVCYRPDVSTCENGAQGDESHWDLFATVKVNHNRRLIAITSMLIALLVVCLTGTLFVIYLQNADAELAEESASKVLIAPNGPEALISGEDDHDIQSSTPEDALQPHESQPIASVAVLPTLPPFNLTDQLNRLLMNTPIVPLPTLPPLLLPGLGQNSYNFTQFNDNLNNLTQFGLGSLRLPSINSVNLTESFSFLTPSPPPQIIPQPMYRLPNIEGFPVISNEELQEIAEVNEPSFPQLNSDQTTDTQIKPLGQPVDTTPLADIFRFLASVFDRRSDLTPLNHDFELNQI